MALTITLGSQKVPHVQVVIPGTDLPSGSAWTLTASYTDGLGETQSYRVRGGSGVAASAQVVLVDVAAPVNVPVAYSLAVDGSVTVTGTTTRTYVGQDVMVAVDGSEAVDFMWEAGGGDRRQGVRRFHASDVAGRARPPLRLDPVAGAGGGSLVAETYGADTSAMRRLLASNAPCYLLHNHDGCVEGCDLPFTDLVYVTGDSNDALDTTTRRRWSLAYLLIDDPEPNFVVPLSTWDAFDTAFATWTAFDAYFAGKTWDEFDRTDWSGIGA